MNIPSYTDIKKDIPDFNGGLCAQTDPELFFPTLGQSLEPARALCDSCPFLDACREWGDRVEANLYRYELFGVLAGESPDGRFKRRNMIGNGGRQCVDCGRALRSNSVPPHKRPGTVPHAGYGRCNTCLRIAINEGVVIPPPRRTDWSGKPCKDCGRTMWVNQKDKPEGSGVVKHHAHGMCSACCVRARKEKVAA